MVDSSLATGHMAIIEANCQAMRPITKRAIRAFVSLVSGGKNERASPAWANAPSAVLSLAPLVLDAREAFDREL
jgi:hypothetical protein